MPWYNNIHGKVIDHRSSQERSTISWSNRKIHFFDIEASLTKIIRISAKKNYFLGELTMTFWVAVQLYFVDDTIAWGSLFVI